MSPCIARGADGGVEVGAGGAGAGDQEVEGEPPENLAAAQGYRVLKKLYKALSEGDVETVKALVAPDIEWWFHGPPSEQHLMRMLTGVDRLESLAFEPTQICYMQGKYLAEGLFVSSGSATVCCWVHVFTIKSGKVVELREYFNTSVTVKSGAVYSTLWQSKLTANHSMPGLFVAI